jgi:malonate-semialdehyde dehydrogenase (acetylating)/methylmalonate-semialdehyde dehydrogenase
LLAEIFLEGGLPSGVLNVVQGGGATFEALITSPEVQAVSFVGSTPVARHVWETATAHHKRVQALGGAKNFIIAMPDANPEETVQAIVSSTYGCAGERCMASSVLIAVGKNEDLMEKLKATAKRLRLGSGLDPATQMGPLITSEHKKRVEEYIRLGEEEGAELILDGREAKENFPQGNFLGATIFDRVKPEMRIAREEIFGPVLSVMHASDLGEAIDLANTSAYGNGASIFTSSGAAAREFRNRIECGMIGINAGVPAPMAFFSFGGRKNSFFGDLRTHGNDAVEFYTRKKAVIERWPDSGQGGNIWGK